MATLIQRQFVLLALATALLFVFTTFFALNGSRPMVHSASLQVATSKLSSLALLRIMSMEIPLLGKTVQASLQPEDVSLTGMLFELSTGIAPGDLRMLLGRELPGFLAVTNAAHVMAKQDQSPALYVESPPPPTVVAGEKQADPAVPPKESGDGSGEQTADPAQSPPTRQEKDVVFIYHTHNRESWLNVAKRVGNSVDHPTKNITLVGKRLAQELRDLGIGAIVNTDDIQQRLLDQGRSYALAYAESLKVVAAAKQNHRELQYFFDIHRDDISREKSTVTINGKTYARVSFVIGTANKDYEKNLQFAKELHKLIEQKYPGLSRGVNDKNIKEGHGEYNQSISPGSLLIEVGATRNTLEESYNTAEALAEVFAEYYWQAEKVFSPADDQPDKR
ncbi:stage II sporulation protein P [Brevibacillus humidisoli]|uniref:stage II sporulation protein P n=1 Tax=Brevibacillus humidisoli TaxID=2895522 RepID=UPI001E2FD064|nr:stage II sporulation protein P [Brevibacillus humidisoli]UFJ38874.1 stage II sporulation protein P [Brevibacillus humidisoli]